MRKIIIFISVVVLSLLGWYGESRSFFCLPNGKCVTVWKTFNNVCYIVPNKYYGLIKPSGAYLETTNSDNLTIYFTNQMPNALIYKSEQHAAVVNNDKRKCLLYDYNTDTKRFDKILYIPNAKRNNDINSDAQLMDIFIHDNFAQDKNGIKL